MLILTELFCPQVLGETMHITTQYLANEEKAVVANSKVEALEVEAFGLVEGLDHNHGLPQRFQGASSSPDGAAER